MSDERSDIGRRGEELAARHLVDHGYTILARNVTSKIGEIDIVAEKDGILCFVEVRSRSDTNLGHPAQSINEAKIRKIRRNAEYYLVRHGIRNRPVRFDVATVVWNPKEREEEFLYFENAF